MYAAAENPALWTSFLASLIEKVGGRAAVLHSENQQRPDAAFIATLGLDESDLRRYAEHFVALNPYLYDLHVPHGTPIWADALVDLDAVEKGEYFNEYLVPQALGHPSGVVAISDREGMTYSAFCRPWHSDRSMKRRFVFSEFLRRTSSARCGCT